MDIQPISTVVGNLQQGIGNGAATLARANPGPADAASAAAAPVKVPTDAVQAVARTTDANKTDVNQLKTAVEKVNKVVQMLASDLKFSVDEDTGVHVVKVIDQTTHDVIRQIPSDEMLAIARSLDQLQGLLVKQKV